MTTTWTKDVYPGGPSLWASDQFPWTMTLPWQFGFTPTVWTINNAA